MAFRSTAALLLPLTSRLRNSKETLPIGRLPSFFFQRNGRLLREIKQGKECLYIRQMERERMKKLRKNLEKVKMEIKLEKKIEEPYTG